VSQLEIHPGTVAGARCLGLRGELTIHTAPELRSKILRRLKKRAPNLALDLTELEMADTAGVATLIEAQQRIKQNGGKLVLFGLGPRMSQMLEMTRVAGMFTIVESEHHVAEALE